MNKKGFTLIELMVMISIIFILFIGGYTILIGNNISQKRITNNTVTKIVVECPHCGREFEVTK